jgi:hypothetical protein
MNKGCAEGFEKAYEFGSGLAEEFGLSAKRCIFVCDFTLRWMADDRFQISERPARGAQGGKVSAAA